MGEHFYCDGYTDNIRGLFSRDIKQPLKLIADGEVHFRIPKDLF